MKSFFLVESVFNVFYLFIFYIVQLAKGLKMEFDASFAPNTG